MLISPRCALAIVLASTIACASSRTSTPTPSTDDSCPLVPVPPAPADSISAVFTSAAVVAHAPNPTTAAERFLFGHSYEPLVRMNCRFDVSRGLAKTWTRLPTGTEWRIVLRDDARFSNGDRVTASDVVASWRATGAMPAAVLARAMVNLSTIVDDTTLDIRLGDRRIATLGSAQLAVAKRVPGIRWPIGTGPYRIRDIAEQRTGSAQRSTLLLEPMTDAGFPRVVVHVTTPADGRDLVDAGADLIITDDRSLSSYRSTRPGVTSSRLESPETWLVVTHAPLTSDSGAMPTDDRTAALRKSLADLVVRSQAQPASSARWYPSDRRCDPFVPPPAPARGSRASTRVVYRNDQSVGRALAERLVALASSGDAQLTLIAPELARARGRATAVGLPPNAFETALRSGSELGYIVSTSRTVVPSCGEAESLTAMAPWLAAPPGATHFDGVVAPLIETRPVAVIIPGRAGFSLSGDGTVAVLPRPRRP